MVLESLPITYYFLLLFTSCHVSHSLVSQQAMASAWQQSKVGLSSAWGSLSSRMAGLWAPSETETQSAPAQTTVQPTAAKPTKAEAGETQDAGKTQAVRAASDEPRLPASDTDTEAGHTIGTTPASVGVEDVQVQVEDEATEPGSVSLES
eukprot:TRINITY_DN8017_c0_g1_i4.p2 TRINITY_DN8017_c0_g1~~TRINITY_DN8017_c0_g1_i4.p2  ORF type:complete len:150 (+),score=18.33 TRINITY_DN8017_c0_g1_i4:1700-2149(+)